MTEYIVITARVIGGNGQPFTIEHYASIPYPTKKQAVSAGFAMYDSDDFFIGVLKRDLLHHCEYIESDAQLHENDLPVIGEQIGFPPK